MLPERFTEPAGFQRRSFTDAKGARIRYGALQPEGDVRGAVVLIPGFREPLEKYFEVVRDMAAQGFSVWIMDQRGQGGSERFLKDNPQKMHSEGYGEYIATLHRFTQDIVKHGQGPLLMVAHSMGAHIGLRYMKEHPDVFDAAALSSPMLDIQTPGFPRAIAQMMVRSARAFHGLHKYIPGGHDWSEKNESFKDNDKTSDPERFAVYGTLMKEKPELRMGDPTYGWIYHTFESVDILNKEDYLKSIKTPILMAIAGKDAIVDVAAEERASRLLPHCTRIDIPDARHEILMERDELRAPWLARVKEFMEEQVQRYGTAPKKPKEDNAPRPGKPG